MKTVVSAILIEGGRILLTQRRADKDFAWSWECPGGKANDGESHHQALARELHEELGVRVAVVDVVPWWTGEFHGMVQRDERQDVTLHFYRVSISSSLLDPKPRPLEGQGIGWFTPDEMRALKLAPANERALVRIVDAMVYAREAELDALADGAVDATDPEGP